MNIKKHIFAIVTSILIFLAIYLVGTNVICIIIWMFIFGDTHFNVYKEVPYYTLLLGLVVSAVFLLRAFSDKLSQKWIRVYFVVSTFCVCFLLAIFISGEIRNFSGWTAESALNAVLHKRYPEKAGHFTFSEEKRIRLTSFGRGPTIVYLVKENKSPLC